MIQGRAVWSRGPGRPGQNNVSNYVKLAERITFSPNTLISSEHVNVFTV